MRDRLSRVMEFDLIVQVYDSGEVSPQHYGATRAPEFNLPADEDGQLIPGWDGELRRQATAQGWSLMSGYSAAHGQGRSPLMDSCESIGGRMAAAILATPGLHVAVMVTCSGSDLQTESGMTDYAGWMVAYRTEDGYGDTGQLTPEGWRA